MSKSEGNDDNGGDEEKVVIEQRLLKIEEVFIYRIPPMRSADGHRAEDWNLAKPLNTCSLVVARRDNDLCVNILAERPKPGAPEGAIENYLFAQSNISVDFTNPSHKIEHWVNPVVDSSRYFAVRIKDSKSGREAFIGVGFRERTDATNFRMSLEDYINSIKREEKAAELQKKFEDSLTLGDDSSGEKDNIAKEKLPLPKSSLSLKAGEKLHININIPTKLSPKVKKATLGTGGGLRLPPPPPDANAKTTSDDDDWGDFQG